MALLSDRQLGNSRLIVNLSPKLSHHFPVLSAPWQHACQASPSKSVPAHPDSFSHFPSLLPSYLALVPYPMPTLITPGVLSALFLFLFWLFISKSSETSYVHSMQGVCIRKKKKKRLACLSCRGIHLGNILLTFKQSWHPQAQR